MTRVKKPKRVKMTRPENLREEKEIRIKGLWFFDIINKSVLLCYSLDICLQRPMTYREKTPTIVSILQRRLKPGKTFEDFQKAHLPSDDAKKNDYGYETNHFAVPTRVINAVSAEDPSVIYSIGLSYGDPEAIFDEAMKGASDDKKAGNRRDKLSEVCDSLALPIVAFVGADNDYGGRDPECEQVPLAKVTSEVVEAMQAIKAQSSKPGDN